MPKARAGHTSYVPTLALLSSNLDKQGPTVPPAEMERMRLSYRMDKTRGSLSSVSD